MGELDPLLFPEFAQMPELDLQLTRIRPQNPDLAVLLGQRSIQRRHRAKLPSLAKTPFSAHVARGPNMPNCGFRPDSGDRLV